MPRSAGGRVRASPASGPVPVPVAKPCAEGGNTMSCRRGSSGALLVRGSSSGPRCASAARSRSGGASGESPSSIAVSFCARRCVTPRTPLACVGASRSIFGFAGAAAAAATASRLTPGSLASVAAPPSAVAPTGVPTSCRPPAVKGTCAAGTGGGCTEGGSVPTAVETACSVPSNATSARVGGTELSTLIWVADFGAASSSRSMRRSSLANEKQSRGRSRGAFASAHMTRFSSALGSATNCESGGGARCAWAAPMAYASPTSSKGPRPASSS